MTNCSDPDQDLCSVGPDLGPNCLQRLSTESPLARKELIQILESENKEAESSELNDHVIAIVFLFL